VRYLPEQDPEEILAEVRELSGAQVTSTFSRPPVLVDPDSPYVQALRASAAPHSDGQARGVVGRDGASDAVSFLRVGIPAVEFGPVGGGHHGPDEWVSIPSLASYRQAIVDFVTGLERALAGRAGDVSQEGHG
jgi:succinyl-diaminopimelate desuccinylase